MKYALRGSRIRMRGIGPVSIIPSASGKTHLASRKGVREHCMACDAGVGAGFEYCCARRSLVRSRIPGQHAGIELVAQLRPYLRHCGESHRPAWTIEWRKLLDFLLVYIDRGKGCFELDGQAWDMQEHDLFWIPPDTPHRMEGFAPSMDCTYIHFDLVYRPEISHWDFSIPGGTLDLGELMPLMHTPLPEGPLRELGGRIRGPFNRRVGKLMHQACEEAAKAQAYAGLKISGLIVEMVAEILAGNAERREGHFQHIPALERAAAYLRKHCKVELRVEEAAEVAGLSESHFRRMFRSYYGMSPREYLRYARIQEAKQLMMEHMLNFTQIAYRCGFASVHSFSRAFRSCEGKSPRDYMRAAKPFMRVEGREKPYQA